MIAWAIRSLAEPRKEQPGSRGATTIVSSKATTLGYAVPNVIATNITPPSIQAGQQTIHFFPDVALVVQGKKIGAIGYSNLEVQSRPSPFIEERTVPADAKVIRYTWKYTNKKGGPDRQFSGNYQIPVCLYEEAYITSKDGLNELMQFSRAGVVEPFSGALGDLARRTGQAKEPSHDKPNWNALLATDGVLAKDTAPRSDKPVARRNKGASGPMEEQIKEPLPKLLGELDDLVGADEAKEKIRRLSALAAANQARRERGIKVAAQTYHLVFAGNPGTGKTTFARLIARIFHSLGYLKKGHLVEVDRSGLVGGYLGQTALKTQEVVDKAKGGVLFIDEVYALVNHDDQYGQEAIATLVKAMEDLRDEIIVIVAGYTERMEGFLNANPGLRSRFRETLHFKDLTVDQLYEVFQGMVRRHGMALTSDAACAVRECIESSLKRADETFGNAREMRRLFEQTLECQSVRITTDNVITDAELTLIEAEDVRQASAAR